MGVVERVRNFLKRIGNMEETGLSEETMRGKFGVNGGRLSGVYECLVRMGIKKGKKAMKKNGREQKGRNSEKSAGD